MTQAELEEVDPFFEAYAVQATAADGEGVDLIVDDEAALRTDAPQRPEQTLRVEALVRTSELSRVAQRSQVTLAGQAYRVEIIGADDHGVTRLTLQRWR